MTDCRLLEMVWNLSDTTDNLQALVKVVVVWRSCFPGLRSVVSPGESIPESVSTGSSCEPGEKMSSVVRGPTSFRPLPSVFPASDPAAFPTLAPSVDIKKTHTHAADLRNANA